MFTLNSIELRNARQFKEFRLNLETPITVLHGPNGGGKSTVQTSLLAAFFRLPKKERDSLISEFDPGNAPSATLSLARSLSQNILLTRSLTSDHGQWEEGGVKLSRKGQALSKVEDAIELSASSLATLLWATQEKLTDILGEFPADGHSLLTNAVVKGNGADPKQVIAVVDAQYRAAKKGGKEPGALTRAKQLVDEISERLTEAESQERTLKQKRKEYEAAREQQETAKEKLTALRQEQSSHNHLMDLADQAERLQRKQTELAAAAKQADEVGEKKATANAELERLQKKLVALEMRYRLARYQELNEEKATLSKAYTSASNLSSNIVDMRDTLTGRDRPSEADEDLVSSLRDLVRNAETQLAANGLNYEVDVEESAQNVRISEDGQPLRDVSVRQGKSVSGVVGSLLVSVDGVTISASGRVDVKGLKAELADATRRLTACFARFGVESYPDFESLVKNTNSLNSTLKDLEGQLAACLQGQTLLSLEQQLKQIDDTINQLGLTVEEIANTAVPESTASVREQTAKVRASVDHLEDSLGVLSSAELSAEARNELSRQLTSVREHLSEIESELGKSGLTAGPDISRLDQLKDRLNEVQQQIEVAGQDEIRLTSRCAALNAELKHLGPTEPSCSVREELGVAIENVELEQTSQDARQILTDRLQEKIDELSQSVPQSLSEEMAKHLEAMSTNALSTANLESDFVISTVAEGGDLPKHWRLEQLSVGERALTALALKLAVATTISKSSGPVFICLDDSFVNLDPTHRRVVEAYLSKLAASGQVQILLLTCQSEWAAVWQRSNPDMVQAVSIFDVAETYRTSKHAQVC